MSDISVLNITYTAIASPQIAPPLRGHLPFSSSKILWRRPWMNSPFFLKKIGGHKSFLWGHWYPCFRLLITSALGFKARVDSLIRTPPGKPGKWEYTLKTWKYHGILKNLMKIMEKWYETWKKIWWPVKFPQNPLKYLNRLEGRFINLEYNWNGHFFVQMKIGKFVDVNQNNLEITLKIMKKYLEIYWKTWKIMEKSWNFVSPEKWEPWSKPLHIWIWSERYPHIF